MLVIEHNKVSARLALIRAEVLKESNVILNGSMTILPKKSTDSFNWDILPVGESFFEGYTLDYGKETIGSMIKEGLKRAVKNGKIPFFQK